MGNLIVLKEKRDRYLELIASGSVENDALLAANLEHATYIRLLLEDPDFAKQVEVARKHRAEHWIQKIAKGAEEVYDKDEVPGQKLVFDKLSYLAKADNPDRYGGSGKGANVNINIGDFRLVSPEDAKKILAADPFSIEAEFTELPDDEGDLL